MRFLCYQIDWAKRSSLLFHYWYLVDSFFHPHDPSNASEEVISKLSREIADKIMFRRLILRYKNNMVRATVILDGKASNVRWQSFLRRNRAT